MARDKKIVHYTVSEEFMEANELVGSAPTFMFRPLTRRERAAIGDRLYVMKDDGSGIAGLRIASVAFEKTLARLCGWKNVVDEDGMVLDFDEKMKEDGYDELPEVIQDLLESQFGQ